MMLTSKTPGVYEEEVFPSPPAELRTGVPAFLGFAEKGQINTAQAITFWPQFEEQSGAPLTDSYLAYAVRGFFENNGQLCYVIRLDDTLLFKEALLKGLDVLTFLDTIDLVCAPDIMTRPEQATDLQQIILDHCESNGDCFAILDSLPDATIAEVSKQRQALRGINGALYYPWVKIHDGTVPPCGHVAGVYARNDQRVGIHKAPANEVLEGVLDLTVNLTVAQQSLLNPIGVNCLRAFPGRGIRVWGARTLADEFHAEWIYVNVRRLFLTAGRWIERTMAGVVFEPNDLKLWARITRELTGYCNGLFQHGALKGSTAQEAFYVKCDAETNTAEVREAGMVVTEIGLAPARPSEFVVVRIIKGASGVTITGPMRPA